jgi:hypothetical protein
MITLAALAVSTSGVEARSALRTAIDANGNLFFVVNGTQIRKLDVRSGSMTTVAGAHGHAGDEGPALAASVDPVSLAFDSTGNLFLSDFDHQRVRRVDARTGTITTIAGNGRPHVNYVQL